MKPARFRYHAPGTLNEAVHLLSQYSSEDGRILAGGQSLMPSMALRVAQPGHLIDINAIAELERIVVDDGKLSIGACVRHAAFHRPVIEGPLGLLLSSVVRHVAHYPIRTRGTFCGSLAHADPSSEWCLTAVTLGATMVAESIRGRRALPAESFFEGIMTTVLAEDELLTQALLPLPPADTKFGFYEFSRRVGDYAMAMALVTVRLTDGVFSHVRIGVGGAEGSPRRLAEAEEALAGREPSGELLARAAEAAAAAVDPIEDAQADAPYRRDLVRVVTRRALERALT